HTFFLEKMYPAIRIKPLDEKRIFDGLEREIIYYRDGRKCKNPDCGRSVAFNEARFHHIVEHGAGGATVLGNGILVCSDCHKDRVGMQNLAQNFLEYLKHASAPEQPKGSQISGP